MNIRIPEPFDPETQRGCRECHETKPIDEFKKLPSGAHVRVCTPCQEQKRLATRAEQHDEDDASGDSESPTDARIQRELWRNYRKAKSTHERIRCLEALVKLRPQDAKTAVDDPAVIASLMAKLKEKKKANAD